MNDKLSRGPLPCSIALVLALAGTLWTSDARANGFTLAAELGPEVVLNDSESDNFNRVGLGIAARAGYTFNIPLIAFTPEAKIGFQSPGTPNSFTAMGGARINFFDLVSPAVFAHAGGLVGELSGFVWDVGAGLDIGLVNWLDFGIFASYSQVGHANFSSSRFSYTSSNWQWMQFGGQCAIHF